MALRHDGGRPRWSRRSVLTGATALAGAAMLGGPGRAAAAPMVDPARFVPESQFRSWGAALDRIGLRATGSAAHEQYVHTLAGQLSAVGVSNVHLESYPLRRWLATHWSLEVAGQALPAPAYVPYSGVTGASGITAPLVHVRADPIGIRELPPLTGKIAVYDVPSAPLSFAALQVLQYPGGLYDPRGEFLPGAGSPRPWSDQIPDVLRALKNHGAIGSIGILDLDREWATGQYFPFDGIFRDFPSLYVDRDTGAVLTDRAAGGASATVVLQAEVANAVTSNVVGFIPGMSDELTVLHTHTDGTNGLEENGQYGIVAAAQELVRLPRSALPRTILILLATGHFYGGLGALAFLSRHAGDLVPKMTAAITVEHLGAMEYLPAADGAIRATGRHEPGTFFSTGGRGLVDGDIAALRRADAAPAVVARPFRPNPIAQPGNRWVADPLYAGMLGLPKPALSYPGDGGYLSAGAGIPDSNYLTSPYYLLNAGMSTVDKIDFARMRAISMALVDQTLALAAADREYLGRPT